MNLEQAKIELLRGKKIRHRYFSPEEYIYQEGNEMVMEDGARISAKLFWLDRTASGWGEGWEEFN